MFNTDNIKQLDFGERFVRRNPLFYPSAYRQFSLLENSGFESRRDWVEERLRTVLRAAMDTRYGRSVGGWARYRSWPLLDKQTVRERPQDFLSQKPWLAARASTDGTTGTPLKLLRSPESVAVEQACIDRLYERLRIDPQAARIAVLRGDNITEPADPKTPYWRYGLNGRRLILCSRLLSPATLADYARAIETFHPDLLYAYPTSLENLCRLLGKAGRRLRIPRVITSSEVLRPESWQLARRTLDCTMIDYYGQAERLAFAYAFEPRLYRFLPGYAYIELIPQETNGTTLYEIVGTSLWNLTMPLVRYRTGDLIRLPTSWKERELEEVTLGLRPFTGVLGREQEVLLGPNGARLTGINQVPRDVEHVLRIQIIQESAAEIRILVIPDKGYTERDAAQLLSNLRLKVAGSMKLQLETVDELERTARGKVPFVIHRPAVQEALRVNR